MSCRRIRELLPLYADDDLGEAERAMVAAHLEGCPACRERLSADQELRGALQRLAADDAGQGIAPAVRARVMAGLERESLRRTLGSLAGATTAAAVLLLAGALVLLFALTGLPLLRERTWPGGPPTPTAGPGAGWQVVRDETIARPYYWPAVGERLDRTPQLSPDGTRLVYLPTIDGQETDLDRLVVRDLTAGRERDLAPEAGYSYSSARWSPDSRSIAFVKHRDEPGRPTVREVWRVDADGQNLRLLYRGEADLGGRRGPGIEIERWSADGRYVELRSAVAGDGGFCNRLRADGSGGEMRPELVPTLFGVQATVGGPVVAPTDDCALALVRTQDLQPLPAAAPADGVSLVLYDLESGERRVLGSFPSGVSHIDERDLSPDGEWIAFRGGSSAEPRLWLVRRDGTGLREVPLGAATPPLLWAGGGRAYLNQGPQVSAIWICALDAASGRSDLVTHRLPVRELVSASRDGRRLLIIRGEGTRAELCLLELGPKPATAPPHPTATPGPAPQLGAPLDLLELPPAVGTLYRLSSDRRWVAYTLPAGDGKYRLVQGDLESGRAVTLLDDLPAEAEVVAWLGDQVPPRQVLVLLHVGNGQRGSLFIRDLAADPPLVLATPEGDVEGFGEAAISPDGQRVAFTVWHSAGPAPVPKIGIEVVGLDGSGRRQIVSPEHFVGRPVWTPDGTQIVYFKGKGGTPPDDGESYVVSAEGPLEPRLVIARARLAAWSPDGTQALWLGEPPRPDGETDLWLAGLGPATGTLAPLVKGVDPSGAAWVGDGAVAYVQEGALYMLRLGAGSRPERLSSPDEWAGAPVWAEGRGLIYAATREGTAGAVLRLLPLPGVTVRTRVPVVETAVAPTPGPLAYLHATARLEGLGASGGTLHGRVTFTNQGSTPLRLQGHPQVTLVDARGQELPVVVSEAWDVAEPDPAVVLPPGGAAFVELGWANYCAAAPERPLSLRLILPGEYLMSVLLETEELLPRCNLPGQASTLSVGPFRAAAPTPAPAAWRAHCPRTCRPAGSFSSSESTSSIRTTLRGCTSRTGGARAMATSA